MSSLQLGSRHCSASFLVAPEGLRQWSAAGRNHTQRLMPLLAYRALWHMLISCLSVYRTFLVLSPASPAAPFRLPLFFKFILIALTFKTRALGSVPSTLLLAIPVNQHSLPYYASVYGHQPLTLRLLQEPRNWFTASYVGPLLSDFWPRICHLTLILTTHRWLPSYSE